MSPDYEPFLNRDHDDDDANNFPECCQLETPTVPKTGHKFKDWAWKPEGYYQEHGPMNSQVITDTKRIQFQWKANDGLLEINDPISFHTDPGNKAVTIYKTASGKHYCVKDTWDVMISVKK